MTDDRETAPLSRASNPPLWTELEAALDALSDVPFAVAGVALCPPPVVRVHGVEVSWPLSADDERALRDACTRSAFGHDGRTVVDDEVRSAWELEPARFSIEGLAPVLEVALDAMARALGEGPLVAELYKLLHYERGDHFREHRDGIKQPGMIGTLVIGLPGEHEGGELRVSLWGDEVQARLDSTPQRTSFIGFHADCLHELRPIEQGHRTCLSFTVRRADAAEEPPPRFAPAALVELLARWRGDATAPGVMVVPLAHLYPGEVPDRGALKGRDRALVRALGAAASAVGAEATLRPLVIERYQQGYSESPDHVLWYVSLDEATRLPIASLVWPWTVALLTGTSISTYMGNDGEGYLDRYRTAALVLHSGRPPARHDDGPREGRESFDDLALAALLERARARRWRSLDLRPLRCHRLRTVAARVNRLGEHLERLVTPSFRWLGSLRELRRLRELCLHVPDESAAESLPAHVMAGLRSLELHAPREFPRGGMDLVARATALRRLVIETCGPLPLPEELEQMPLRELRLKGEVRELPPGLGEDGRLEELVLRDDRLKTLPAGVVSPSLRVLAMDSYLASVPAAPSLRRLRLLVVPGRLPSWLGACRELISLELRGRPQRDTTGARFEAPEVPGSLRRLSLTELLLTGLPELSGLPRLEALDASDNLLASLPASVGRLGRLRELRAARNPLTEVPDLSALTRLRVLDLACTSLRHLPGLSSLTGLEVLALQSRYEIWEANLGTISMPGELVIRTEARARTTAPTGLDLTHVDLPMPQLRELRLDGVRLPARLSWLAVMTELQVLELEDTGVAELVVGPGGLPALRELNLDDNDLVEPPPVERMPGLRVLSLCYNPLRRAPRLSPLRELRELLLVATPLAELPIEPGDLPRVWKLRLNGCKLTHAPRFDLLSSPGLHTDWTELYGGQRPELTPENRAILRLIQKQGPWPLWDGDPAPIEDDPTTEPGPPASGEDELPENRMPF